MDMDAIAYGPLLWLSFSILLVGILTRTAFFVFAVLTSKTNISHHWKHVVLCLARSLAPYQKAFLKMPIFIITRYLFHFAIFIVPIFLSGHIVLWEESRFSLSWPALPDYLADVLTVFIVSIGFFLLARKAFYASSKDGSKPQEFLLIIVTLLPFVTGFIYANMDLSSLPFLENNIGSLHVIFGEAFLILIPFLFLEIHYREKMCIGCGACAIVCPTGTLNYRDVLDTRSFLYQHFQCISCGTCVCYCPESAIFLRHDISVQKLLKAFRRYDIFSTRLSRCDVCGVYFAPEKQMSKLRTELKDLGAVLASCPRCRSIRANAPAPLFRISGARTGDDRPEMDGHEH